MKNKQKNMKNKQKEWHPATKPLPFSLQKRTTNQREIS
jgi:hypothetical protein